ncbi:type VII secretion-associated protein [Haloechinothrix sp. LS1_15]|uniref:type VII secretion-associated protein n=1 Tax=Haloechinothrix sp. LS1_15 TaxID=2652248 RepID=UPI0029453C05|nr:type VII secretion-associated protein [Haloechinothrix sp. LS1_15]MDV6013091.1 type VII secretion-associated protein [Haloechinothrix sp. LS1_15]
MSLRVAVDFGASSTCVVASLHGREPQVVVIDGHPLLPSAVYAAVDGTLFAGLEAERHAAVDPSRYEPHPKRRVDEGELLLGTSVVPVRDAVGAVLRRAVAEARRFAGDAEVELLVLTHPADWGIVRTRVLRQAAGNLAREVALVPEPVAAAVFHAESRAAGRLAGDGRTVAFSGQNDDALAVLDLGGGTVDVSVVQRLAVSGRGVQPRTSRGGFRVLATRGDPAFGGADIDQALLEHVGTLVAADAPEAWRELVEGRELDGRRRRRMLRQDVRGAKETLSRHAYTDVPLPEPFSDAHVTREDLERLITAPLGRAVEMTSAAITDAGLRPQQLVGIFLVGGSSRIPLISRLVHERLGIVPTTLDQPETVVARGAMRAVLVEPDRTGALPGTMLSPSGPVVPPAQQRTAVVGPVDIPQGPQRPPAHLPAQVAAGMPPPVPPVPPGTPPTGARQAMQADSGMRATAAPGQDAGTARGGTRRRRTVPWLVGGGLALAATVATGAILAVTERGFGETQIEQHDFRFTAPPGWVKTGSDQESQLLVMQPEEATGGDDRVVVRQFDLNVSIDGDFASFADELEELVHDAGDRFTGFERDARFAGRDVIHYIEPAQRHTTDWYVMAEGHVQVSVGCRYTRSGMEPVEQACEQVVRTLAIVE